MAGSNFGQSAGGFAGLVTALQGAYNSGPKASSNRRFIKQANSVGMANYGASDIAGLMSQISNTPTLRAATRKDFYDPSSEELFGTLFGSGMAAYGASQALTGALKGFDGKSGWGSIEAGSANSPTANGIISTNTAIPANMPTDTDILKSSSGQDKFDMAAQMPGSNSADFTRMSVNLGQNGAVPYEPIEEDLRGILANDSPWAFACGGHKHGCGGHKFGGGGSALATGIDLSNAGLGILSAYLGQLHQRDIAEKEAVEANAANDYARQMIAHNQGIAVNDTKNNMFNQQALQMMAMGGDLQTHGGNFPLNGNLNIIGAGGRHEDNPFGGVYQGMAEDGKPNLVEEDEVVWNDYVFSNRLTIPNEYAKKRKLKEGITFAEAAKKLSREARERPNDPISENGLIDALGSLQESQEEVRAKKEAARVKREIAKMSPGEVMNMVAALQGVQQPQVIEQPIEQQPVYAAEGGHLYPWGGYENLFNVAPSYAASNSVQYLPYTRDLAEEEILRREADPIFIAWTQYVNDNWDTEEVQNYLKALDAKAGGNHLFDKDGNIKKGAKEYFNKARTDHKWGYYHLTPQQIAEAEKEAARMSEEEAAKKAEEAKKEEPKKEEEEVKDGEAAKRKFMPLQTISRYTPLLSILGALQGPAKDYSTGVPFSRAHYTPIGDYLPYNPVDTQRYINAENQQAAAQLNAIMNASTGNRNMAMAQAALANQQRQQGIGQRMQVAEQINFDRLAKVGEFNRGTNMFNAQAHNQSELANLQINPLELRQAQQNAMMRYQADKDRDAAVSESLNAFLDSFGDIGRENFAFNQANSNEALRYGVDGNPWFGGDSYYKTPTSSGETYVLGQDMLTDTRKKTKKAGKITRKIGG